MYNMDQLLNNANIILCKATYNRESIENVLSVLLTFEQDLSKIKKKAMPEFIQKYGCMLSSIQYNLYTLIADPNNADHKTDLLNSRNRIFFSKLPSIQPEIVTLRQVNNGKQMMGYSPRGKQLRIQKVQPRMTTTSSLVISSQNGIHRRQEVEGSFNTDRFMCFLDDLHLPLLAVILLDNVSFHHSKRVKSWAAENQIDLLYTPPYSPWFNPIEGIFSIVKRSFYKHGIIQYAFDDVKEHHCKAFFNKSFRESDIRE